MIPPHRRFAYLLELGVSPSTEASMPLAREMTTQIDLDERQRSINAVFFIPAEPGQARIGVLMDAEQLRPSVAEALPRAQASQAYEHKQAGELPADYAAR